MSKSERNFYNNSGTPRGVHEASRLDKVQAPIVHNDSAAACQS